MSDELDELRHLPREVAPDPALEARTVAALRARQLLRAPQPPTQRSAQRWLIAATVGVIAFSGGVAAGRISTARATPAASFALMLYGGSTGSDTADHSQRADEYRRWVRADHEWGRVVGGEALGDRVSALSLVDTSAVRESGIDELVGFFLVTAPNRQAAVRLAADCPHLKYGGRVVVREIQPT